MTNAVRFKFSVAGICCALALLATPAMAQQKQIVVSSWGGSYSESQRKAFFEPFEKATGIKVVEGSAPKTAVVKAMVESGNVQSDVVVLTAFQYFTLAKQGLLEKIDYSKFSKATLDGIDPSLRQPYGVAAIFYSNVIAYNTEVFKDNPPKTWAEFWDVKRFPGPRALRSARVEGQPDLEAALMADGVPMNALYPLDVERALKSVAKIKPSIVKWFESPGQAGEMLARGDVVLTEAPAARIADLKAKGAKVNFVWNEGKLRSDYWAIPKGAKNVADALRFIDFALKADRQAEQVNFYPGGPTNLKAYELIPKNVAATLPSSPENLAKQYKFNDEYWLAPSASDKNKTNQEVINERWNALVLE